MADLNPIVGSEQAGRRPVLIVQGYIYKNSPTTIVAPITSRTEGTIILPTHCELSPSCGLLINSVACLEQIRTIDKQRLLRRIGEVSNNDFAKIDNCLKIILGLEQSRSADDR